MIFFIIYSKKGKCKINMQKKKKNPADVFQTCYTLKKKSIINKKGSLNTLSEIFIFMCLCVILY